MNWGYLELPLSALAAGGLAIAYQVLVTARARQRAKAEKKAPASVSHHPEAHA
jgi:hypothetical protein